ncbi:hypothetical protein GQ44DRAFT_736921 [Phaeosphaeriaceae sp. PMI808]|nr:hypothetical protein GQ44DRAFT_736921 [Phaeosphaeriaceae sp. PMI808]
MLRNFWILAFVALSSAINLGDSLHIDGIEEYIHQGAKRQASGTGNTPTPNPPTSSVAPPSSRQPTSTPTPSTPINTPTPPPSSTPAPSTPPPSTPGPASRTQRSSADAPPSSNPVSEAPRSTAIVRTSHLVSTSLQTFTTIFTTEINGAPTEVTSTGTNSIPVTTGQAVVTDPPTSRANDGDNGGLSDDNKKVIGGVVGGVGGALLLGGIALVFWRMKKRQSKVTVDDDDLTLNTGAALGDKTNGTGASPFQSNLEQYHNPGGRPNAAANF